jgi:NlpC/P60 family putative phage cell wall peptidase
MTVPTAAIVSEARAWIATPYVHQQATKGAGCDCLGLVRGVWRAVMGTEPERPPAYSMDWS